MVMYRDFAQRNASSRGIVGTVKNLPDGIVEVFAEGEEGILKEYIERLKKGPLLSRVDKVDIEWREPEGKFNDFSILF